MPPSEATRQEPSPVGVEAMPTIGALSESAPIAPDGMDCMPTVTDRATEVRGFAFVGFVARGFAAALGALEELAPAAFSAVARAATVTRAIAEWAINLDALRLRSTMPDPLALPEPAPIPEGSAHRGEGLRGRGSRGPWSRAFRNSSEQSVRPGQDAF